jgi:hypothetical protein
MVSVYLIETRSVDTNNQYKVECSISTSSGISSYVFVKREYTYEFDRIATVQDMMSLPETPDPSYGYYRDIEFTRTFEDVSEAQYFSDGIKQRLDTLVEDYETVVGEFIGTSALPITSA